MNFIGGFFLSGSAVNGKGGDIRFKRWLYLVRLGWWRYIPIASILNYNFLSLMQFIYVSSGYGSATSSGLLSTLSTSDGGVKGVSGALSLSSGSASYGYSGAIWIGTGSATGGRRRY